MKQQTSYKLAVQIQSYNRYDKLSCLISEIKRQEPEIDIVVVDDCSKDSRYKDLFGVHLIRNRKNNGKERYWATVNSGLRKASSLPWDYLVMFSDDIVIDPNFFEKLRIELDGSVVNFFKCGKQIMWDTDCFVDGLFAAPRSFWVNAKFRVRPIPKSRWAKDKSLSSGVWFNVTREIKKHGFHVKRTEFSLVQHDGNNDSKMHPSKRLREPIIAQDVSFTR